MLIIMGGLPGSGKTTVSRKLAEKNRSFAFKNRYD
jgi:cytidylate kinase